jgi:hypothetical protein
MAGPILALGRVCRKAWPELAIFPLSAAAGIALAEGLYHLLKPLATCLDF